MGLSALQDKPINPPDILIAEQLALGLRTAGDMQYAHADMNTDGIIKVETIYFFGACCGKQQQCHNDKTCFYTIDAVNHNNCDNRWQCMLTRTLRREYCRAHNFY